MVGAYDFKLVALSVIVAIIASFTALELAGRVSQKRGAGSWSWLVGGAVAMGSGIWSMHFIGMLAFHLPLVVAYDTTITLWSMAIAIAVSGVALFVVRRPALTWQNTMAGATLMGLGISAMHYTGMQAMQMSPAIEYDPWLFAASVVIAFVASFAALWIAFRLRQRHSGIAILAKLGSATVMGLAITGMHYTGMAAAQFAPDSVCLAVDSTGGMQSATLALAIGSLTLGILVITLGISALDAHYAAHTAKLANSLLTANEQLRNLALYDNLTGLPNRMLLDDRMAQAASQADRAGKSFALMFLDLDRFKPVNDSLGHRIGDELLKGVAKRLTSCIRNADTVARTGGDEFVVVLSDLVAPPDAALVGKKILDELSRPFFIERHELSISCSIGISIYPRDGKDVATLQVNADMAMYQAKRAGRNSYRFFMPEMSVVAPA
jgi:diguanylate cyclase (GGDEF)-like protein